MPQRRRHEQTGAEAELQQQEGPAWPNTSTSAPNGVSRMDIHTHIYTHTGSMQRESEKDLEGDKATYSTTAGPDFFSPERGQG